MNTHSLLVAFDQRTGIIKSTYTVCRNKDGNTNKFLINMVINIGFFVASC